MMDPNDLPALLYFLGQNGSQTPQTNASFVGAQQALPQGMNAQPSAQGTAPGSNSSLPSSFMLGQMGF